MRWLRPVRFDIPLTRFRAALHLFNEARISKGKLTALFAVGYVLSLIGLAASQVPPAIPALPDSKRVTQYSITTSTCACPVNFALYADGVDVDNWVEVRIGTTAYLSTDSTFGWALTSPTGSLGSIPRPVTDAILTFNSAQSGTVTITGARRPRRISQFSENRGVPARDLNQAITDTIATQREFWDKLGAALVGQPSETILRMPPAATRANQVLAFDANGNPTVVSVPASIPTGQVQGPGASTIGDIATWGNTLGTTLVDTPTLGVAHGGTGVATLAAHGVLLGNTASAVNLATIGTAGRALVDQGASADPAFVAITSDATLSSAGALGLAAGAVRPANLNASLAGQLPATATNDVAAAGKVGEYISSTVISAMNLANGPGQGLVFVTLTPGDWDIWVNAIFTGNSNTTINRIIGSISTISGTGLASPGFLTQIGFGGTTPLVNTGGRTDLSVGPVRVSLATTTTYYYTAIADFTLNNLAASGIIQARRAR